MTAEVFERILAFIFALVVGGTALVQLKNDWKAQGLDATVTKVLLGLMAVGCVFALLASVRILGAHT
ncbi:MAG: hypothetical protein ACLPYS_18470 [Vulcanimicrobiaceae bacterium]